MTRTEVALGGPFHDDPPRAREVQMQA